MLPVGIGGPDGGQSEAGVSVQFGLTPRPFDGAFKTFTEKPLKEKQQRSESVTDGDFHESSTDLHKDTLTWTFMSVGSVSNRFRYSTVTSNRLPRIKAAPVFTDPP